LFKKLKKLNDVLKRLAKQLVVKLFMSVFESLVTKVALF
tara:strand:+ start:516 stop:632 length:117 start_codon:yes stop_codon:yes gene_type:complete